MSFVQDAHKRLWPWTALCRAGHDCKDVGGRTESGDRVEEPESGDIELCPVSITLIL